MNSRNLPLGIVVVVIALWLSGQTDMACQAVGQNAANCESLTSSLVGMIVGGLISFWASAKVAAASDKETKKQLGELIERIEQQIEEKLSASTKKLTGEVDEKLKTVSTELSAHVRNELQSVTGSIISSLGTATTTLTGAVDKMLESASRGIIDQMQKDLQSVSDEMIRIPDKAADALQVKQQMNTVFAALPLIVKTLPSLIALVSKVPKDGGELPDNEGSDEPDPGND